MARESIVDAAIGALVSGTRIRCKDMVALLENLKFKVVDKKTPGHKLVTHAQLKDFTSLGFNCGHGKNPEILKCYVTSIRNMLKTYRDDLKELLESEHDGQD